MKLGFFLLSWSLPLVPFAQAAAPASARDFVPYTAGGAVVLALGYVLTKLVPTMLKTNTDQAAAFLNELRTINTSHKAEIDAIGKVIQELTEAIQSNTVAVRDCKIAQKQLAEASQPRVQT